MRFWAMICPQTVGVHFKFRWRIDRESVPQPPVSNKTSLLYIKDERKLRQALHSEDILIVFYFILHCFILNTLIITNMIDQAPSEVSHIIYRERYFIPFLQEVENVSPCPPVMPSPCAIITLSNLLSSINWALFAVFQLDNFTIE